MPSLLLAFLSILLLPIFSLARPPANCDVFKPFGVFVETRGPGDGGFMFCNVHPNQTNEQFLFAYSTINCLNTSIIVDSSIEYKGIDGNNSTASAAPYTMPPTTTYLVYPPYTNLPYSSVSGTAAVLFTVTYDSTSMKSYSIPFEQKFSQTIGTSTRTVTTTVNATTTLTSTLTQSGDSTATTTTTTVLTTSGVATAYASPITTTITSTITAPRTTSTKFSVRVVTKTCAPHPAAARLLQKRSPDNILDRRVVPPPPYTTIPSGALLDYCGFPMVQSTSTETESTITLTSYTTTTTYSSTSSETDTTTTDLPSSTTTSTPTFTQVSTTLAGKGTTTTTRTSVITETTYKKGAPACKSPAPAVHKRLLDFEGP